MQQVADYVEYARYALVNRDTGFLLILIVCNNTIGYPGGPERGWGLRTPELSSKRCLAMHQNLPVQYWTSHLGLPRLPACDYERNSLLKIAPQPSLRSIRTVTTSAWA